MVGGKARHPPRVRPPYSKIVSAKGFHHLYIDGFAGPGAHVSRETGELILGSPRIALAIEPPFKEYHFIDADLTRVGQLRSLAGSRPDVNVHPGDCNEVLLREVFPRAKYSDYRRALCVLDPYNIDLSGMLWQQRGTWDPSRSS